MPSVKKEVQSALEPLHPAETEGLKGKESKQSLHVETIISLFKSSF